MMNWKLILMSLACLWVGAVRGEVSLGILSGGKSDEMDVGGEVVVISDQVIEIRDFTYNGEAPDALFWADNNVEPSKDGLMLLPASQNCSALKLEAYDGSQTLSVEFPEGTKVTDYLGGSISVWCRAMQVNLGQIVMPATLDIGLFDAVPTVCSAQELSFLDSILARLNVFWEVVQWLIVD
ncbi:Protein Skeletor, isoforms [Seminavis robusta]|uniref:Protein Skeletor, isoforms n=1 Tax=Seminavis robusta TaxID=568900 RepID=A0A9N8EG92_9STRA|nr:Protein Skeletor, isoforms [Seminavis robusta]|eukprot:Sro1144_g246060.1 Protein Skeletor, isoforms (181) ;mRNA; r:5447-5989